MGEDPEPNPCWCAPSACADTASTPLHDDISIPPSVTESERFARTARTTPVDGSFGSGKFCTLVATYVAIEMPPDVTYSTSVYLLPTGVKLGSVRTSVTESMMLVEPNQKKVAMIASPWCGFVGLNPLMRTLPFRPSEPFTWFRVMPFGEKSNCGVPSARRAGLVESLHAAARSAAARMPETATAVRLGIRTPRC